ncbi:hypothetical protein FSP39_007388 [Pinctada imbricata]|uniref:RecQ-mediated genome instability protein 1 n=1 Tax=Pinctada imbricata TaxID=66713 RepID=A0AA89C6T8_PINIB|nr:hypothetical protein FSP39_007388 [Pinctada imbricata]
MRVNESTKAWLRSKSIYVPDDWLEACIEWINNETQDKLQLPDQLNGAVYEQWLLSDLHELQSPCLPEQLISQRKYQLNGGYALQIDSLVDVSKPYYGQMLKVKGSENENVKVTAEPPAPWEPKPTRMLMLKLTDGVTEVQGMEYRQILCLNEKIKPGTKVLIKGSVLCRNGVLMLKADNVQLLGGEVDTLVEELTPHSALQQAL